MDNAATTRVLESAAQKATEIMTSGYGNPESLHSFGLMAEHETELARRQLAKVAGVLPEEIYFAPSATAANNTVLRGIAAAKRRGRIISTAFEHPAVEEVLKDLERNFEVVRLKPEGGEITLQRFRDALSPDTVLISCMQVNNETGAVTPLAEMAKLLKQSGIPAFFHTDAVQGFLKEDFKYSLLDAASFAGHKLHAPKGIGALYLKKGLRLRPLLVGGGQEKNLFSGTHNVPAIAAWGVSCSVLSDEKDRVRPRIRQIRDRMAEGILALNGVINSPEHASPYVLSAAFPGYLGENILHYLSAREIYISTGSACSSKKPSRVLAAVGKAELSKFALRFSFSRDTTLQDAEDVLDALSDALHEISPIR